MAYSYGSFIMACLQIYREFVRCNFGNDLFYMFAPSDICTANATGMRNWYAFASWYGGRISKIRFSFRMQRYVRIQIFIH